MNERGIPANAVDACGLASTPAIMESHLRSELTGLRAIMKTIRFHVAEARGRDISS